MSLQTSSAQQAVAARQSCQCQPVFVRPGRATLHRATFRTRAQEGEKQDIKEEITKEIKEEIKEVKGFFTGSTNAVRLSPRLRYAQSPLCSLLASYVCVRTPTHSCHMQSRGYTEEDSAGQSNIFAVEVFSTPPPPLPRPLPPDKQGADARLVYCCLHMYELTVTSPSL